jgi:hypothetical protein
MNREMLENVFVTALEGGSNYWYLITSSTNKKIRDAVPKSKDPYFSTAVLTAILDHGIKVDINDLDNPTEVLGVLDASQFEERLHSLEMNLDYGWALEAEENGEGDATSSDVVFQYLVMGDVWFS